METKKDSNRRILGLMIMIIGLVFLILLSMPSVMIYKSYQDGVRDGARHGYKEALCDNRDVIRPSLINIFGENYLSDEDCEDY